MYKATYLVETEEDQRDIRRIILNFEFKEKSFETVKTLHSLIYKSLFENFYDNFIICALFDDKETSVLKKIEKHFNKFENCLKKEFNYRINYAGYLKTNNCKTYWDIKKEFKKDTVSFFDSDYSREEYDSLISSYNFHTKENAKQNTFEILNLQNKKYFDYEYEDINFSYEVFYMEKDYNSDKEECYFGNLQWSICGYTCENNYDEVVKYLEDFFKQVIDLVDFTIGTIGYNFFLEPKILPFNAYFIENVIFENWLDQLDNLETYLPRYSSSYPYENLKCLKSIEWLNYLPIELFNNIDCNIENEELINCITMKDKGVFIKMNKDIKTVSINDKFLLRKYLNNILVKGYCKMFKDSIRYFWEEVPIYLDEIFPIKDEFEDEYEIVFISDANLKYVPNKICKNL